MPSVARMPPGSQRTLSGRIAFTWPHNAQNMDCPRKDGPQPTLLARSARDNTPLFARGELFVLRHRHALESAVKDLVKSRVVPAVHRMYILVDTETYFGENSNSDASA